MDSFTKIIADQTNYCMWLLGTKGQEYSPDDQDRLHTFKVAAALQNITPKQALGGMLAKHIVSVYDMCSDGEHTKEKWIEKISDSINYLLLLRVMIEGEMNGQNSSKDS